MTSYWTVWLVETLTLVSITIGICLEYSFAAGAAVGFALLLLRDIQEGVKHKNLEDPGRWN